jgi:membrane fusion protein, multidrug efflux system
MSTKTMSILVLFLLSLSCKDGEEVPMDSNRSSSMKVQGVVVGPATLRDSYATTGTLRANESAEIRSETMGRITRINFKEGGFVQKGQVLIEVEKDELEAQLKKVEVNWVMAKEQLNRAQRLLEVEGISKEVYEQALTALLALEADKALLEAQLAKRRILSPFSGYIGLREVSLGSYLSPAELITTLQDNSKIKIDFSVPEQYAARLKEGQSILFKPNGESDFREARVYGKSNTIDPFTRTLQVRALTDNPRGRLRVGSFAEVRLDFEDIEGAITIPAQALVPQLEGYSVFETKAGKTVSVPVSIGLRTESEVQITRGLSLGDTVITTGILGMKPGMSVEVIIDEKN